jgi:polyhydroxyalkanoate synthase
MSAAVVDDRPTEQHEDSIRDRLGAVEGPLSSLDPVSFGRTLARVGPALLKKPLGVVAAGTRFGIGLAAAVGATAQRLGGRPAEGPVSPAAKDKRFDDPAYKENPLYFLVEQEYLLSCQLVIELLDLADLEKAKDAKARFGAKFLLDALAPTNTLLGNPAAVRESFNSGGASLLRGARNMLHDLRENGGWPSQVDAAGFELGVNLASTPGQVIYRSALIELIQYAPQTPEVHATPLLFCPAWINKYYISDLAPGKSLIEWAVQHGQTCFAISYRNPDESLRYLSFEDYWLQGPADAVRVIREITGARQVNTISVCLGGTLTAIGITKSAADGDDSIRSATFLNTHTDFSIPGTLGVFTDEATIAGLERKMAKKGFLDGDKMAHTFDALRASDLVFQYVGNNWLQGKKPPAFDLLVWNKDSTRMPAKMHSRYLRSCFLNNEFSQGKFEFNGERLDPSKVRTPIFVLSAIEDHIVPWRSAYQTTHVLGGPATFVLSNAGHIAGIVNPPRPKCRYWAVDGELPVDPDVWREQADLHEGTWWEPWTKWIAEQGGPLQLAPDSLGSEDHPPVEAAPGSYVMARA